MFELEDRPGGRHQLSQPARGIPLELRRTFEAEGFRDPQRGMLASSSFRSSTGTIRVPILHSAPLSSPTCFRPPLVPISRNAAVRVGALANSLSPALPTTVIQRHHAAYHPRACTARPICVFHPA